MAEVEHYTYVLAFSAEDNQYVGTVVEFPSLSWLANSQVDALAGILVLVEDAVADMVADGEPVPEPLADSELSGRVHVQLLDGEYDEFVARLNEPAQVLPGLQALLAKPSPFSAAEGVVVPVDQFEASLLIAEDRAIAPMVAERLAVLSHDVGDASGLVKRENLRA